MKQTKLLFLLLLALLMSVTTTYAQTIGTEFTLSGITYRITAKDLQTHNNTVAVVTITGSGQVTIPASVQNSQDQEHYKVTSTIGWLDNQIQTGVTEVVFPEGLLSIADGSFRQCSNPTFTKITIPSTCTYVGPQCFITNPSFTEFSVATGNSTYKAVDGVLFTANGKTLVNCPSGKSGNYSIPTTVTTISDYAFSQCTKLDRITIPASVVNIASGKSFLTSASYYDVANDNPNYSHIDGVLCNKSQTTLISYPHHRIVNSHPYTIPASITTIGPSAFYVSNVSALNLNNVETIGDAAFQFSHSLETVNIGSKVTSIAEAAFSGCAKLANITVDNNNPNYKAIDNVLFTKDGIHLILCAALKSGNYTVPGGVKYIDGRAFTGTTRLGQVTVSKDVESIGTRAFAQSGATAIIFEAGSKLTTIKESAFYQASKIESVEIPASVSIIESQAFRYMNTLKTITIQDGSQLNTLGNYVFSNNPELTTVTFNGSTALTTIPEGTFSNDPKLASFEIPATVTTIAGRAFLNTPNLKTITFKSPAQIEIIGNGAFAYCGVESIVLPPSVREISEQAFDNCKNLKTIDIPASVTNVGMGAFNMCENLTDINVDNSNTRYSSLDGMLCSKDKKVLEVFPAGKANSKNTLLPYFEKVAAYAFYGSEKVTNITFPKSVTTIEERALALCKNLKTLSFMGIDNVPTLSENITYNSVDPKNITIYVRKAWYENTANDATISGYNSKFKEVHPSFVTAEGYDRGTEFFPTSDTNAGVIGFYTERTSVILHGSVTEVATTTPDRFGKTFPEKEYSVNSILDYAYQNTTKVRAIVVLDGMDYIGLDAFKGSTIEAVYFVDNTPGTLGAVNYEMPDNYPFKENQNIYVKESKVNDYKTAWEQGHTLNITHEIPQQTNKNGGSVCFPFDVKYPSGKGSNDIKPYVPVDYTYVYDATNPIVRAYSIDNYYVPAYVGALIRSKDVASVTSYCQMDEIQGHDETELINLGYDKNAENSMIGAVEDITISNEAGFLYYAFSKSQGKFVRLNDGVTFPFFKSYFRLKEEAVPAKGFNIVFEETAVTGIVDVTGSTKADSDVPYYNMNGMRVSNPQKGVYIHGGKKVIIK